MQTPTEDWMDTAEVAEACGVTPNSILRWYQSNDGFPQPHRFSRRVLRWKRPEVMAFIAAVQDPNNPTPFCKPQE